MATAQTIWAVPDCSRYGKLDPSRTKITSLFLESTPTPIPLLNQSSSKLNEVYIAHDSQWHLTAKKHCKLQLTLKLTFHPSQYNSTSPPWTPSPMPVYIFYISKVLWQVCVYDTMGSSICFEIYVQPLHQVCYLTNSLSLTLCLSLSHSLHIYTNTVYCLGGGLGVGIFLGAWRCQECNAICGDGLTFISERYKVFFCDDGNKNAGDGCSSLCTIECGFICTAAPPNVCSATCGDSRLASIEHCDDGNGLECTALGITFIIKFFSSKSHRQKTSTSVYTWCNTQVLHTATVLCIIKRRLKMFGVQHLCIAPRVHRCRRCDCQLYFFQ